MRRAVLAAVLCLWSLPSLAAEKIPVSMTVVCADKAVGDRFTAAMTEQFKKHIDYELSSKLPRAMLYVYVNQDVNDAQNPNGWSIAIAHINNQTIQYVVGSLLSRDDEAIKRLQPLLIGMVNDPGQLTHLNVAHIDRMSDENVRILVESVVASFFEKISKYVKP